MLNGLLKWVVIGVSIVFAVSGVAYGYGALNNRVEQSTQTFSTMIGDQYRTLEKHTDQLQDHSLQINTLEIIVPEVRQDIKDIKLQLSYIKDVQQEILLIVDKK